MSINHHPAPPQRADARLVPTGKLSRAGALPAFLEPRSCSRPPIAWQVAHPAAIIRKPVIPCCPGTCVSGAAGAAGVGRRRGKRAVAPQSDESGVMFSRRTVTTFSDGGACWLKRLTFLRSRHVYLHERTWARGPLGRRMKAGSAGAETLRSQPRIRAMFAVGRRGRDRAHGRDCGEGSARLPF